MCRRLGPRETESRAPIYIGDDFRWGDDRSVAIGRESERRGGFFRWDRTDDAAKRDRDTSKTRVRRSTSNIPYVETRNLPLWDSKRLYRESSPVHKSSMPWYCRRIHRNDALRSTDVWEVAHLSCHREWPKEASRRRHRRWLTGRTKRTPFHAPTPPRKSPKFRGHRNAWRDTERCVDAWWRARETVSPQCVRKAGPARA